MEENKTALVKKIGEGNKSLSVIVAEDKLTKFKRFSQSINLSMGYLLNQAIDRYLANNSTEIFSTSTGIPTTIGNNTPSVTVRDGDIEELISTTIEAYLLNKSIGYLSKADIEELISTTIEAKLDKSSIGIAEVENLVNTSIGHLSKADIEELVNTTIESNLDKFSIGIAEVDNRITPLTKSISELETYSQNEFIQVREELRVIADTIANPTTAKPKKDPNIKTWAEFYEMLGIKPMRANEAQGKETDTRTKQIEQGIQAAKEQGFGEWAIKVVGRSFVQVDATP